MSTSLRTWLVSPEDHRLRAGWRILAFVVTFMVLNAAVFLGTRTLLGSLPRGSSISFFLLAFSATVAVLIARRTWDRRRFATLGFEHVDTGWKDLVFGFALSGAMAALFLGGTAALGLTEGVRFAWPDAAGWTAIGVAFLVTVAVGYWEELVFRGYILQNMAEGTGMPLAVVLSCFLYGAVHAGNPHASMLSTAIIVAFGFLRIYGLLVTRLLWLSIGMHVGWNFFQGPVFGFAASGQSEEVTLFQHRPLAPDWLSGGEFGPEASLLIIPILALGLWAMREWSRRGPAAPR